MVGFPHIALIDPRTGMKVWSFQGYLEPPEFIEKGDIDGGAGGWVGLMRVYRGLISLIS